MMIFFDIETVIDMQCIANGMPQGGFGEIPEGKSWNDIYKETFGDQFDFMPEYHKILTICCGTIKGDGSKYIKNLEGDEKKMIEEFFKLTNGNGICGFNIKSFDIPFIVKRALFLGIPIPNHLKLFGKKPWEMENIIDLYAEYKHMGFKSGSLDTICKFLSIPSSKDGIDGSMVQAIHDEGGDQRIIDYCIADVSATIDVYNRFKELNFIS